MLLRCLEETWWIQKDEDLIASSKERKKSDI